MMIAFVGADQVESFLVPLDTIIDFHATSLYLPYLSTYSTHPAYLESRVH